VVRDQQAGSVRKRNEQEREAQARTPLQQPADEEGVVHAPTVMG